MKVYSSIFFQKTKTKRDLKGKEVWMKDEREYIDPNNNNKRFPFPSIEDPPSLYLSVVVPAYNEVSHTYKFLDIPKIPKKF
jgi:hypothetical protein